MSVIPHQETQTLTHNTSNSFKLTYNRLPSKAGTSLSPVGAIINPCRHLIHLGQRGWTHCPQVAENLGLYRWTVGWRGAAFAQGGHHGEGKWRRTSLHTPVCAGSPKHSCVSHQSLARQQEARCHSLQHKNVVAILSIVHLFRIQYRPPPSPSPSHILHHHPISHHHHPKNIPPSQANLYWPSCTGMRVGLQQSKHEDTLTEQKGHRLHMGSNLQRQ